MDGLVVSLETVTPLFVGGADPRGEPELRAPAFRGALRYWLRAALAGALGDDAAALEQVRAAEEAVFGSAREGRGSASPVVVRVRGEMPRAQQYAKGRAARDPTTGRSMPSGTDYLFWSMAESGRRERGTYQEARQFWPPGVSFELELLARPGADDAQVALQRAAAALWLLVHLGGIGARSRRAGGSLSAAKPAAAGGLSFGLGGRTAEEVAREIGDGLTQVRRVFGELGQCSPSAPPEFDVLHPRGCRVWVLGLWRSSAEAVEAMGAAMRDFRSRREPDHREVARWLSGGGIDTVQRAAFGLPLPFRYTQGPSAVVGASDRGRLIDRRASPLWLKVSRTAAGGYAGVATLFCSRFLPRGAALSAAGHQAPPPADYRLLQQFVEKQFKSVEVEYE